jgi:type II secretory pathway component GspD/PulD (secretin)
MAFSFLPRVFILLLFVQLFCGDNLPAAEQEATDSKASLITLDVQDVSMEELANLLSEQIGTPLGLFGGIASTTMTLSVENQPTAAVLNQIANPNGWLWWSEDNGQFGISTRKHYERNMMGCHPPQRVYRLKTIKASKAEQAIRHLLTPNVGISVSDNRTNKLIVIDEPAQIKLIDQRVKELDSRFWRHFTLDYWQLREHPKRTKTRITSSKKIPPKPIQKVYRLNSVKASEVHSAIQPFLTPGVGTSVFDDTKNVLIVTDHPKALNKVTDYLNGVESHW